MVYFDDTRRSRRSPQRVPVYATREYRPGACPGREGGPADQSRVGLDFSVEPPTVRLSAESRKLSAQDGWKRWDTATR